MSRNGSSPAMKKNTCQIGMSWLNTPKCIKLSISNMMSPGSSVCREIDPITWILTQKLCQGCLVGCAVTPGSDLSGSVILLPVRMASCHALGSIILTLLLLSQRGLYGNFLSQ